MSPRRTRAATAGQSAVSTRSRKAQKINDVCQTESMRKGKQLQKKSASVKKNLEATVKQSPRKESPDVEVTVKKSVKKRATRRKLNLDKEADSFVAQDNQNMGLTNSIRILKDRHYDDIAPMELDKTDLLQLHVSKDLNSEKLPNGKLKQNVSAASAKVSPVIVTPKTTPPKLNLTPHRSKKTPKKSPIALGSPKTHSIAVPKLFKSPRKLSLTAAGEDSDENLKKSDSDSHSKKSRKSKKDSSGNRSSKSNKGIPTSPTAKNKREKVDLLVRKYFSKSPKIVLKSPKSKKSKSRKSKLLSPSKVRKSTLNTSPISSGTPNLKTANSPRINANKSPQFKRKNLSINHQLIDKLKPKLMKTLTASQMEDVLAEPIVLLEKLSSESMKRKYVLMVANKTKSDTSIKVRSPSVKARNNSKVLVPKVSPAVSTERNSSIKLRISNSNTNRVSPRIKHNTSIQEKDKSPLMASTPREEKPALNNSSFRYFQSNTSINSVNNTSLDTRLRYRNQSNMHSKSSSMDKNTDIENVSSPSLFDTDISDTSQSRLSRATKRDTTYDKDSTIDKKHENNTYELEQPQTQHLRQMIRKRTSTDAKSSLKDTTVKKAKVRFADVTFDIDSAQKSFNKLNGSRSRISHDGAQRRNNVMSSTQKLKKSETPKSTQNLLISSLNRRSPKMHGGTPQVQLKAQFTPKTFASVEKKSEKKSSTKKVPNFARIHEQMFAKSESVVDGKKRLEARHQAFTGNKAASNDWKMEEKKLLPSDSKDGIHNRFGFKLKKPEATQIILKKQTVFSREKQQDEMRLMLKGVRTNRRFELQMKARNLNV